MDNKPIQKKNNTTLIVTISIIAAGVIASIGIYFVTTLFIAFSGSTSDKSENTPVESIEDNYNTNLVDTVGLIFISHLEGHALAQEYSDVWRTTINGDVRAEKLAEYLKIDFDVLKSYLPSGYRLGLRNLIEKGDFNETLTIVRRANEDNGTISSIEKKREQVVSLMQSITPPPTEFESLHKEILEYYSTYEKFIELALYPSGSYNSYVADIRELSSELQNQNKTIKIILPKEE